MDEEKQTQKITHHQRNYRLKSCIIPSISTFFLFLEFYLFSFAELISNGFYSFFASKSIKKTERTEKLWIIQGLPVAQFVLKPLRN